MTLVSAIGLGERYPPENAANVDQLLAWWEAGLIDSRISQTYTHAEGANAIAQIASRMAVGKLVVKIR